MPSVNLPLLCCSLLIFSVTACGHDHENGIDPEHAEGYLQHHPKDPESGYLLMDTLGYPGVFPDDPDTGKPIPEPVRSWSYIDQSGRDFGTEDLRGKVYVADFFFTSCPTICPKVKSQMLRLEERFADNPDFQLVSFTIDPKRDTPERMTEYAGKLGIEDLDRWRFIRGDKFEIYDLDEDYMSVALENSDAPGGFDHSGYIVLVDREGFVRAYASGLVEDEVSHLMEDIELLLDEPDGAAR